MQWRFFPGRRVGVVALAQRRSSATPKPVAHTNARAGAVRLNGRPIQVVKEREKTRNAGLLDAAPVCSPGVSAAAESVV